MAVEHPVAKKKGWISKPATAWALAVGTALIGAWISVFGNEVRDATRLLFGLQVYHRTLTTAAGQILAQRDGVDIGTSVFWVVVGLWVWALALRIKHEDTVETQRALDIVRTIHRSPNINVIRDYAKGYFRACQRALLAEKVDDSMPAADKASALASNLRGALEVIARMAQEFSRNTDVSYGANVMLVAARPFSTEITNALRFQAKTETGSLLAILYMPEALLVSQREGQSARHIPLISLPVPVREYNERGERLALFGAPTALLRGDLSVYLDTRDISTEYQDFAKPIRSEIEEYFAKSGDGKDIRSFACLRIGYLSDNPIGVVNIDCNAPCVLGCDEQFFVTFSALMEPLLDMIAPTVADYALAIKPQTPPPSTVAEQIPPNRV